MLVALSQIGKESDNWGYTQYMVRVLFGALVLQRSPFPYLALVSYYVQSKELNERLQQTLLSLQNFLCTLAGKDIQLKLTEKLPSTIDIERLLSGKGM